jgi:pimeloyl-ACP methyl ester carboxylesterase
MPIPPVKVMPVIVIAGIMGSNLRARTSAGAKKNDELEPGQQAWRPPNGKIAGLKEADKWEVREPAVRQRILDGDTLEVDPGGDISLPSISTEIPLDLSTARDRGWGEIHADSYGQLLSSLYVNLNRTFNNSWGKLQMESFWASVNSRDRKDWGTEKTGICSEITPAELAKVAEFHYPVYAFGYNWLNSNEVSARRLRERIEAIITYWTGKKQQCNSVILVTHSMGGMVARACAKQIPAKVSLVVHGAMPALGAPVCYRRVACGTEASSPGKGWLDRYAMGKFSEIAGPTACETTPVLALSSGPLELMPTHLYPKPWLFAESNSTHGQRSEALQTSGENPYRFYRDFTSWYRAIDPELADPAEKYAGNVGNKIAEAIGQAERFHTQILGNFYHPNTAAFYSIDDEERSFGHCRWIVEGSRPLPGTNSLKTGKPISQTHTGERNVEFGGGTILFRHSEQDTSGDGTVPRQSGSGVDGNVQAAFATRGYTHQDCYSNDAMLALTHQLIVKLLQRI